MKSSKPRGRLVNCWTGRVNNPLLLNRSVVMGEGSSKTKRYLEVGGCFIGFIGRSNGQ